MEIGHDLGSGVWRVRMLSMWFEEWPIVTAEVTFLRLEEGGRASLPAVATDPSSSISYRPHVVIQDRNTRQARIDGRKVLDEYHAIGFLDRSGSSMGESGIFRISLMYYPDDPYTAFTPGATFTVREGWKVVAHGAILSRKDPLPGYEERRKALWKKA